MLIREGSDEVWGLAVFESRESYVAYAHDPKQHEHYLEYRALMASEPEWHDGEILAIP